MYVACGKNKKEVFLKNIIFINKLYFVLRGFAGGTKCVKKNFRANLGANARNGRSAGRQAGITTLFVR